MNPVKYVCPACKQKTGLTILYGMPSEAAFAMAKRGEIALGGCCMEVDGAERKCANCGHEWRINRRNTNHE